jgi:ABC-type transport system involved in multi-copper enzyme maturation permease subunit
MTTATPTAPVTPYVAEPGRRPGFGNLMAAEWTKIRSVRSTVWTLVVFVVIVIGLTALVTWLTEANWYGPHAAQRDSSALSDPVGFTLDVGILFGQLVICVLGVLVISTEYSTGVIRASLLAVPRRIRMLSAKALVFTILLIVVTEVICLCSFFVGSAILHSHVQVSLGDHNVLRAVIGGGLFLTVLGLFSMAVGALIRHTAGGIGIMVGVVFVVQILTGLLPGDWGAHVNAYMPEVAGRQVAAVHQDPTQLLSAWQGFGVFCGYTLVLLIIAAYLLRRRDA